MSPNNALIDVKLERMLVAAIIANPEQHDGCGDFGLSDLADPQSSAAWEAFANVVAGGQHPTRDTLRAELQRRHELRGPHRAGEETPDLRWLDELITIPLPADPPVALWASQLVVLAETRRGAIADAQPAPTPTRRAPRGPRAENAEPVRLAEAFRRYSYERDDTPTLIRWARAWWRYNGVRYVEHDDELLLKDLIAFLDVVVAPQQIIDRKTGAERVEVRRITSRGKTINEVRTSLVHVMPALSGPAPQWTEGREGDAAADDIAVCENGLLNLRNLTLMPSTPRFFSPTAVGCAWDPDAPEPAAWLKFLRDLWGDDTESVLALQQLFGYLLTPDTSLQKIFALIGPARSGKGTIGRVLRALLGHDAVVNPTLQSLERPFGLAPLVGKSLAIIGDARLGGHSDQQQVVERLLSISGEDALSIDRKNRDPINVRLRCRVLLLSNELPRLYDTSGALASRFVILQLSQSFLGSEDPGLEVKLLAELPGILRWAIDGREDLHERGRFVQPLASEEAVEHLRAISSPIGVFLDDCCEIDPAARTDISIVYESYTAWCKANGREPANRQIFGRDLATVHPEIKVTQYRRPDSVRIRAYQGLRLSRAAA